MIKCGQMARSFTHDLKTGWMGLDMPLVHIDNENHILVHI